MKTKLLVMLLVAAALSVPVVAGPIKIVNPGFEADILADGAYTYDSKGWHDGYYWGGNWYAGPVADWASGVYNPVAGDYLTGEAPVGENIGLVYAYPAYETALCQILQHTFIKKAEYTLTAKVGNPSYNSSVGNYRIELLDGNNQIIGETTGSPPAAGTWIDVTLGPVSQGTGSFKWNTPMQIRLYQEESAAWDELHFDEITLTTNAPTMTIETPDMTTWDVQGVALSSTQHDGTTSLTGQTWTADPPDGVVFSGGSTSPPENALDPTVTVTVPVSGLLTEASIVNHSFEVVPYGDGAYSNFPTNVPDERGWVRLGNIWAGDWDVPIWAFANEAYDGENCGYVTSQTDSGVPTDGFTQVLGDVLRPNVEYTLTVFAGWSASHTNWGGYHVQLLAGGVILDEDINTNPPADPNKWAMATVVYNSGPSPAPHEGELLEIRLEALDLFSPIATEIHYDDVHLISDPPAFTQPAAYSVTVTVQGEVQGNAVVSPVSIELSVYKDPCTATLAVGLKEDTDFDSNCIAGLSDLAVVLETWTDDLNLTGPVDD